MKKKCDCISRAALRGRMPKMIMVMMLAIMITVSGIAPSFSVFAQDTAEETAVQIEEAAAPAAEVQIEAPAPDPEPEPASDPEPEPVKEDPTPAAADDTATQDEDTSDAVNDTADSGSDTSATSGDAQDLQTDADNGEEKEDKEIFPAQDFSGSTSDLYINVSASEGVFPEGTKLKAEAVSASLVIDAAQSLTGDDSRIVDAAAADITFWSEGKEIQPKKAVKVKLTAKRALEGESHEAITVNDKGDASVMSDATSRTSSFNTNHFTVYGIIGEKYEDEDVEQYVRHTYEFYAGDPTTDKSGWSMVSSQIVKNGDELVFPADPAGDAKHVFEGWFIDGATEKLTDSTITINPATVSEDADTNGQTADETQQTIKVYAKFDTLYKITLYAEDKTTVFQTVLRKDGEIYTLPTHDEAAKEGLAEAKDETNHKKLDGWVRVDDDANGPQTGDVTVDGADLEYYAHFAHAYTVRYETVIEFDDFSVPDQKVFDGDYAEEPNLTTLGFQYKDGYELLGWYTKDGTGTGDWGVPFGFASTPIDDDITLFAKWEVKEVNITIELYLEAQNTTDYEFIVAYNSEQNDIYGEAGREIPWEDILTKYPQSRTFQEIKKLSKGHWAGTGYMDDVLDGEESWLSDNTQPAIVVKDSDGECFTASLTKNSTTPTPAGGCTAYKVNPDGSTTVRLYYARDTYNLHFVFSNQENEGAGKPNTMPEAWEPYAPEGYAGVTLPTYLVKNGTHLGKRTHNYPDSQPDMFDAFLQDQVTVDGKEYGWKFSRVTAGNIVTGNFENGETVFDASNMTYDIRPDVADSTDIYIRLEYVTGKTDYPYEVRYYDRHVSQQDILDGKADDYVIHTLTKTDVMTYTNNNHSHMWYIGYNYGGYRLAAVTDYGKADGVAQNGALSDGAHSFTWKKNNKTGKYEPLVLHNVPAEYEIIFRQTANGKTPGGWNVEDPMEEIVVGSFAVDAEIDIPSLMTDDWFSDNRLQTMTDRERRVEYTATGNWKLFNRITNTVIPGTQPAVTMTDGFPDKMPAQDLIFYMEWVGGAYQVTIDWNCYDLPAGVEKVTDYENVQWNETITKPATIQRTGSAGWKLVGWEAYERDPDGTPGARIIGSFSFTTPVRQDFYLKAKWENTKIFTVLYKKGANGTLPGGREKIKDPSAGSGRYAANALAPVKYTPTPYADHVFIGWAVQGTGDELLIKDDGTLFGSGDTVGYRPEYDKDGDAEIVLIAQYDQTKRSTGVTYHSNYPGGDDDQRTDHGLTANGTFKVKSPDELGFGKTYTAPNGCMFKFKCWTNSAGEQIYGTDSDGREYFDPGEKAAAQKKDEDGTHTNNLYAVWEIVQEEILQEEVLQEEIDISVEKIWDDDNDRDNIRPDSVKVQLYANGDLIPDSMPAVLNGENEWTYTWTGLPKNENGEEIVYTVAEVDVPEGYKAAVSGDLTEGFTITNTHTPEKKPEVSGGTAEGPKEVLGDYEDDRKDGKVKKSYSAAKAKAGGPATGDETKLFIYIGALSAALVISLILLIRRRREPQ